LVALTVGVISLLVVLLVSLPLVERIFGVIGAQLITAFLVGTVVTGLLVTLALIIKWRNERIFVTSERLIAESRVDLIWSHSTELPISEVQHLKVDQLGVGPILGFGDIAVKSAAEGDHQDFFYGLPHPFAFVDLVNKEAEADRKEDHA
jgi:hypothetical protein